MLAGSLICCSLTCLAESLPAPRSIAPSFGMMAFSLDKFTAGSNNFSGALPEGFASSLVLKTLDLSNNSLSGR